MQRLKDSHEEQGMTGQTWLRGQDFPREKPKQPQRQLEEYTGQEDSCALFCFPSFICSQFYFHFSVF